MRGNKLFGFLVAAIVVALVGGCATAPTPTSAVRTVPAPPKPKEEPKGFSIIGGYVVSLTAEAISVEVQGTVHTLKVTSGTRLIDEQDKNISASDLIKGTFVRVTTTDATASEAHTIMKAKDTGYTGIMTINQ